MTNAVKPTREHERSDLHKRRFTDAALTIEDRVSATLAYCVDNLGHLFLTTRK